MHLSFRTTSAGLCVLLLSLCFLAVPTGAQESEPPARELLVARGQSEGLRAAKSRSAANWFWNGFAAGSPAGPAVLSFASGGGGDPAQLTAFALTGVVASAAVIVAAGRSRVDLYPGQKRLLEGEESEYSNSYSRAFTGAVHRKRVRMAAWGAITGAAATAGLLYGLICLAYCGEGT